MKFLNVFKLFCFFVLSNQLIFANSYDNLFNATLKPDALIPKSCSCDSSDFDCNPKCIYASSTFDSKNESDRYEILTQVYPTVVRLSKHRNHGFTRGNIELTSRGVRILKSGDYWVSFKATLLNKQEQYGALIPVFVVRNGQFSQFSTDILGNIVILPSNVINTGKGSGVIKNLKRGTRLSIVATNSGSPEPQPITVISWNISLFKLPCCDFKKHH